MLKGTNRSSHSKHVIQYTRNSEKHEHRIQYERSAIYVSIISGL